ncbi:ABC transporter ATP-binding protein, partial [Escherichia coli]
MVTSVDMLSVKSLRCGLSLENVTFAVRADETICLLGRNDSGKTTLLHAIAGLLPIEQGEILFDGQPISTPQQMLPPEQRQIGMLFQDYALFPHLTVEGNVAFGLYGQAASDV